MNTPHDTMADPEGIAAPLFDPDRFTNPLLPRYGVPDDRPGPYYASAIQGERYWLLLGPFEHHADAMEWVEAARSKAYELDPSTSAWMSFGTARLAEGDAKPGMLNQHLGLPQTLLGPGTRPRIQYRLGRARSWTDEDNPLMRGWEW